MHWNTIKTKPALPVQTQTTAAKLLECRHVVVMKVNYFSDIFYFFRGPYIAT